MGVTAPKAPQDSTCWGGQGAQPDAALATLLPAPASPRRKCTFSFACEFLFHFRTSCLGTRELATAGKGSGKGIVPASPLSLALRAGLGSSVPPFEV